jgi:ribose 5-phosphate isomerase B
MFKTIAIGCDHAAFEYKEKLVKFLEGKGYKVLDMGTDSTESCDYPIFADRVCNKVTSKEADCGILICGTGIGMSMAANKHKGIRAAVVGDLTSC